MQIVGLVLLSLMLQGSTPAKVEVTFDGKANFGTFHTYSWTRGYDAFNPTVHKVIVEALEAQMTAAGFTKVATGGDVTLAYYTVGSTDVDLKALDKAERAGDNNVPTRTLGRLVVAMRRPAAGAPSNQTLWTAGTREFVDSDPVKMKETINQVAARLFDTYPGRKTAGAK